jgi:pimeloyl-ACP methyl ester carboxylesterase
MDTVTSNDGTVIAFQRSGVGPPLVLVHGTTATHARWGPVLPALEQHFSVYALDRRGRGGSGDAGTYAIEREFEDVAAVVASIDEPVNLLGHSYGAICALEAARLAGNLRRLVLYEPPILEAGASLGEEAVIDQLQALLDAGDREAVVTKFFREVAIVPEADLARLKAAPVWPDRVALAHTLPRECRGVLGYRFDGRRFADFTVPTLLLLGGDSPPSYQFGTRLVDEALPDSRIVVLPGQQHIAMDTAPELFTREVLAFLAEPARV